MSMSISGMRLQLMGMAQMGPKEMQRPFEELMDLVSQSKGLEDVSMILAKLSVVITLGERHLNPMVKSMLPQSIFPLLRHMAVKLGETATNLPVNPTREDLFRPMLDIVHDLFTIYEQFLPTNQQIAQAPQEMQAIEQLPGVIVGKLKQTIQDLLARVPENPTKRDINTAIVGVVAENLEAVEPLLPVMLGQITQLLPIEEEDRQLFTTALPEFVKNFRIQLQDQLKATPDFELGTIARLAIQSATKPLLHKMPPRFLEFADVFSDQPTIVKREQVPFERWSFDHNQKSDDCVENWSQRGWAVLHLAEAGLKIAMEAVAWVVAKIAGVFCETCKQNAEERAEVIGVLGSSFVNSAIAIWSPDAAKEIKDVGCSLSNWKWGTSYDGTRTTYLPFGYDWKKA